MSNTAKLLWFIFGLGSQTQLLASLSISEVFVLIIAPFVVLKELPYMRQNGVVPIFVLSLAVVVGCVLSCVANSTPLPSTIRGLAVTCLMTCSIVVAHWALRKNMNGFKWWLVGAALSNIVCTFIFQKSVEVSQLAGGIKDSSTSAAIMGGTLYWIGRLKAFVLLPCNGWYLSCPIVYSVIATLSMAIFALATSVSGRSAAMSAFASAVIIVWGGKRIRSMQRIGRHFTLLCVLAVVMILSFKVAYSYSASRGLLGDEARIKYEKQTHGDSSLKAILLGGRFDSFCGLLGCFDKPIIGNGPWAMDTKGYIPEFLQRYAASEDIEQYVKYQERMRAMGISQLRMIPCHSIIVMFWLWYGIAGLIFWLYVCFVFIRYLKSDCWAVPQWYMWLAASLPLWFWNIFFSPFGDRVGSMLFIVACLLARAVRKGRLQLPMEMVDEINRHERKRDSI